MDFECKSCKKPFKASGIDKHLTKKKECQSQYTEEEMQAISKMLTSARHQRYEKTKRKERAQKIRTYKLKKGVDQLKRAVKRAVKSEDKPEV